MNLDGKKVAIFATDGFEQSELLLSLEALQNYGAEVRIISLQSGTIRGWADGDWGKECPVDETVPGVSADSFHALVLPGGVMNPDTLRRNSDAVDFVRAFFEQHKPVAAICHGPQVLIDADVVRGRQLTSFESIKNDLLNAGAEWIDSEVVVDQGLVTSRTPDDLEAFISKTVEEISEGKHAGQTTAAHSMNGHVQRPS